MYLQKIILTMAATVGAAALAVLAKRAYDSRRDRDIWLSDMDDIPEDWVDDWDDDYDEDFEDEEMGDSEESDDVDCETICPTCNCGDLCGCRKKARVNTEETDKAEASEEGADTTEEDTKQSATEAAVHHLIGGILGAFDVAKKALEEVDAKYPEWRDNLVSKIDIDKVKDNIDSVSEKVKDAWATRK